MQRHLGSGAMGEVYAAHDPVLNRTVAIKLMRHRASGRSPAARVRFLREAQALARLNHPNVVAVYDAGTVGDNLFVAMELVDGPTIAAWLAERPRSAREVVEVFLQAGRGLAAAHAAGITHRDVKPSNIMLGDRVRVVDFGLARPADDDGEPSAPGATVLDVGVTGTGDTVGTPAYMAPEQRGQATCSPLSDQYSFAVALKEALTAAPSSTQAARPVPAWLRPLLDRALQPAPEARFPSMNVLLAQLARNPYRVRRRWLTGTAVVIGALGLVGAWRATSPTAPCVGADARLAGVWDAPRSAQVHAAFAATHLPYAEATWTRVRAALDEYRQSWLAMHVDACRATRVEGHQSEALMDLRIDCLERRRSVVAELTQLWLAGTDRDLLATAGDAVARLPSIAECAEVKTLGTRTALPGDPAAVATIAASQAEIDRIWALTLAGRPAEARTRLRAAIDAADATGWVPVRAEARYLEGYVLKTLGVPAAEQQLLEASQLAGTAHDDRLAANALIELVHHLAANQQSAERATLVANIAEGAIARAGGDDGARARLLRYRGDALESAGKLSEARELYRQSWTLAQKALGASSADALASLSELASVARRSGDNTEANRLGEQALAATQTALGADHPRVAAVLNELGAAAYNQSRYDAAADHLTRALAIVEAGLGPDSVNTAVALCSLGANEIMRGRWREARALVERALAIRERMLGPSHPRVVETLEILSSVLQLQGELPQALALAERQLAIVTATYGPTDRHVADALVNIADIARARGDTGEALRAHQRALEIRRKALGNDHERTLESIVLVAAVLQELHRCREARPLLAEATASFERTRGDPSNALETTAECELADGQPARAATTAARAIALCDKTSETGSECPSKYWVRARALDALGRRSEAIAAARHAEQQLSGHDVAMTKDQIAALRAWLTAQTR